MTAFLLQLLAGAGCAVAGMLFEHHRLRARWARLRVAIARRAALAPVRHEDPRPVSPPGERVTGMDHDDLRWLPFHLRDEPEPVERIRPYSPAALLGAHEIARVRTGEITGSTSQRARWEAETGQYDLADLSARLAEPVGAAR